MSAELIARLEAAKEGSRELDILVALATTHIYGFDSEEEIAGYPSVTTSLDASLALSERVLERWAWEIRVDESGATVQAAPGWWMEGLAAPDEGGVSCDAATPALALCIAVLRAKQ